MNWKLPGSYLDEGVAEDVGMSVVQPRAEQDVHHPLHDRAKDVLGEGAGAAHDAVDVGEDVLLEAEDPHLPYSDQDPHLAEQKEDVR